MQPSPTTPPAQPSPYTPESVVSVGMVPKRRRRWPWVALVLVLAAAGGGYYWWSTQPAPTAQPEVVKTPALDMTFAPNFTSVAGYAKYQDAEWYAAQTAVIKIAKNAAPKYYAQNNGVPLGALRSMVVHKDHLWVASGQGVAVLKDDGSIFEEVKVAGKSSVDGATQNGALYEDKTGGVLYFSTYTDLYKLNDTSRSWEEVAGVKPINPIGLTFNQSFGVANANAVGSPVWVYSRKSGTWKLSPVPGMTDQTANVINIGDELFIMGRPEGYGSCEAAGKVTATVAFRLDADGAWQPMTEFNADKARLELKAGYHVKDATPRVYTMPCGNDASKAYDVSYTNGKLILSNEQALPEGAGAVSGSDGEQTAVVAELSKATKLYPFTEALALDKSGNVIFAFAKGAQWGTTPVTDGLAIADGADFTKGKVLELTGFEHGDVAAPVMCDGLLKYAFVGRPDTGEGGPTGSWATAKLISVEGTKTKLLADLEKDVSAPVFACAGSKVSWLSTTGVKQIDTGSKKITAVGETLAQKLNTRSGQAAALPNGDLWLTTVTGADPQSPGTIYYFDAAKAVVTKLGTTGAMPVIEAADEANLWVSGPPNAESTTLTTYGKTGAKTYAKALFSPVTVSPTGNGTAVVVSGATKQPGFRPLAFNKFDATGASTQIPATKIPVRMGYDDVLDEMHPPALYDANRKRVWTTDMFAGLFAIPL